MSVAAFLRSYDAEVRAKPVVRAGLRVEDDGQVVRLVGSFNFVCNWRFGAADASAVVGAHADHFRTLGEPLIWRVHEHDGPPGLAACLADQGFEPSEPGTLMFLDLDETTTAAVPGLEVRRISTAAELAALYARRAGRGARSGRSGAAGVGGGRA